MSEPVQSCSAESRDALIKRLQERVDAHDKACFGSTMALGYYSGNDARLMRDAIDALRLPDVAQAVPVVRQVATDRIRELTEQRDEAVRMRRHWYREVHRACHPNDPECNCGRAPETELFEREVLARKLHDEHLKGLAYFEQLTEPNKETWYVRADAWIEDNLKQKRALERCSERCDFFSMLWRWFEERRGVEDMRGNVVNGGLSADDFKQMLDEHEANLIHAQPQAVNERRHS